MTKGGEPVVAGYLNPLTDPKPEEIALFQPDKTRASLDVAKTKYILSLIGDQFCQMVQQERRCLSVHLGANKAVAWKRSVRGGQGDVRHLQDNNLQLPLDVLHMRPFRLP